MRWSVEREPGSLRHLSHTFPASFHKQKGGTELGKTKTKQNFAYFNILIWFKFACGKQTAQNEIFGLPGSSEAESSRRKGKWEMWKLVYETKTVFFSERTLQGNCSPEKHSRNVLFAKLFHSFEEQHRNSFSKQRRERGGESSALLLEPTRL